MWQRQHAHEDKQEIAEVRGEVGCGFQFDDQRDGGVPDFREDFQTGLDGALGPALLLGLEAVHLLGQFSRDHEIWKEEKPPSF